jgi:hypothetical protein
MKKTLFWILAVLITVSSAIYQKKTGPTYPKKVEVDIVNTQIKFKLPRSGVSDVNKQVEIPNTGNIDSVSLFYRRFPLNEAFTEVKFQIGEEDKLIASLPTQPPAGKLEYYLSFNSTSENVETEHIVIRFKGSVPKLVLIPHILLMFIAMLLSNLSGILAIGKEDKHVYYGRFAFFALLLGGMILGPVVQLYAFGELWTGVPFGWDLTDNKTLIAVIFWLIAVLGNRKSPKYRYTLIASIVLFLIYMIPHSVLGSELDYESGEVVTGFVQLFF